MKFELVKVYCPQCRRETWHTNICFHPMYSFFDFTACFDCLPEIEKLFFDDLKKYSETRHRRP